MRITQRNSDEAVLRELGARLRRHRLQRDLTQAQLAREAGVSKSTVERMEAGASTQLSSFVRLFRALELLENFDALLPEPLPSPMERLELGKERQRARPRSEPESEWTWGDDT